MQRKKKNQTILATKRLKNRYLQTLGIATIALALVRCAFPGVADSGRKPVVCEVITGPRAVAASHLPDGELPHRIYSVHSYREAFPDSNAVQLVAARRWGVRPVRDRRDAEDRRSELVFMGASPYYRVDPLQASIPYLVPRASILLQDIGQAFFDSLQVKGVPLHRFIVTSVLRSQADVSRLRRYNPNATEQSCHLYGTTFDIAYNCFEKIDSVPDFEGADATHRVLLNTLGETLKELRDDGRCYVKFERGQPCYHITTRQ